jgi:hypothetical protein
VCFLVLNWAGDEDVEEIEMMWKMNMVRAMETEMVREMR